ncbi:MAG: hypothetical protein CVU11_14575 [Bacteroidetes bacterium HGW-Bacteroidetes-6]|jgi:hypothetical protein|nr:MAG: hypothetical protein CVU11_14575 [Bacteroidetes bacterium HGW-Bacteroidetes-6]
MEIIFSSLHHIDHGSSKTVNIPIVNKDDILARYIRRLLKEITTSPNKKSYKFTRDTTEVCVAINQMICGEYDESASTIASRLLSAEQAAQMKMNKLNIEIQKGSLFQTIFKDKNEKFIIISKADHNEFIDVADLILKSGLPWKKRVYKALMARISDDNVLSEVYIFDSNSTMTRYWWDDFFELEETRTDKHNTITSLDIIDMKVLNPIKKDFPADHTIIRNGILCYFRTKQEFELDGFIEYIVGDYTSVKENFPLQRITEKLRSLPSRYNFDNRFEISKQDIKKRAVNRIKLTPNIDLLINGDIDLANTIIAEQDNEGTKYIKIKSDSGYNSFKR